MTSKVLKVFVAALSVYVLSGAIVFFDGNKLHEACQNSRDSLDWYIVGAIESDTWWVNDTTVDGHAVELKDPYCLPVPTNARQAMDVVCKYIESNPDRRHFPAAYQVRNALSEAFPC